LKGGCDGAEHLRQSGILRRYSALSRSIEGLDAATEWPALRALLPELRGRRVLDLGCGFGWFSRWAREQGAARVLGIDLSERMLTRARATTSDTAITYIREDLERVELPEAAFDLAYSSLALHYLEDLAGLLAKVYRALVPGGRFVFSVEHCGPALRSGMSRIGGRPMSRSRPSRPWPRSASGRSSCLSPRNARLPLRQRAPNEG